jgi:hypothetical protein
LAPRFYKKIENRPFCPSRFLKEIEMPPFRPFPNPHFYYKSEKTPPNPPKSTKNTQVRAKKKLKPPKTLQVGWAITALPRHSNHPIVR